MRTKYNPELRENAELDTLFLTLAYALQEAGENNIETGFPMQKMLDYIHDHVNSPIDMADLCNEFNYSPDYISKTVQTSLRYHGKKICQPSKNGGGKTASHNLASDNRTGRKRSGV